MGICTITLMFGGSQGEETHVDPIRSERAVILSLGSFGTKRCVACRRQSKYPHG